MNFDNLHQILRSLYEQMMPLCGDMAGVAKGIAGLGALFYVAYRVWQSLARAEPIDVFPMLRPFAIGLCIMFFPTVVLGTINSIMSPVVQGTAKMLEAETLDMNRYREQKDKLEYEAMMRNPETAYLVSNEEFDKQLEELGWSPGDMVTMAGMYIERGMYNMKKGIRDFFREILELMFQAAALVIDTIRTFFLVVLAILGPIAFAISVWDGFQSTLTQWICRYIQVYLWLPVSDMFSTILAKIQVLMLQSDIERMQADPNFSLDSSDGVYIVFMIIGIIGYFTIPTVAGWIIQAGGMGSYGRNVNQTAGRAGGMAGIYIPNPDAGMYSVIPTSFISFDFSALGKTFGQVFKVDFKGVGILNFFAVMFSFLFVDLFDTLGTLIGVASKADMLDEDGKLPHIKGALLADSIATCAGAVLGTSTTTTFVESASGVTEGGRTGLTSMTTGVLFLLAVVFSPLFLTIPSFATAPALVIVGFYMMGSALKIDFSDPSEGIPAFLTILAMPTAYSISEGIAIGVISWTLLNVITGKASEKKISPLMYVLTVLFILKYVLL